jgi:porin
VIGGIGGNALFVGRPQDSFSLGYFYYAFSNDLRDALDSTIYFDGEQGLEAFYNYAITPWFKITGDIRYINPSSGNYDNALVLGLRFNTLF